MQSIVSQERTHMLTRGERRPSLNTGVTGSLMAWPGGRSRRRAHNTTPSYAPLVRVTGGSRLQRGGGVRVAVGPGSEAFGSHRPHPRTGRRPLQEQRCPSQRGDAARVHQMIQNAAALCADLRTGQPRPWRAAAQAPIPSPSSCR
jgi:hypothetical protein